jgi:hypothetical protein
MKTLRAIGLAMVATAILALTCAVPALAQSQYGSANFHWVFAIDYAQANMQGSGANNFNWNTGPTGPGSCQTYPNGSSSNPYFVFGPAATPFPLYLQDSNTANSEVVSPSTTFQTGSSCGFSSSTNHSHITFYVKSGTGGLQEALYNNKSAAYPTMVVLDPVWKTYIASLPGSQTPAAEIAAIPAAFGTTNLMIVDVTTAPMTYYTWTGAAYTQLALAYTPGILSVSNTQTTATPGSVRTIIGAITTTNASFSDGGNNLTGVRGTATFAAGTTVAGGYANGTQGKLILAGTVAGTAWIDGLLGQLDISAATLTSGSHVTPIWSDAGATGPSVTCAFCDSAVLTNTTATTFNSLIYGYSKAGYLFDLSNNGSAFINGSTASAGSVTGYLKIKVNGTDAYIAYKGTPGT